MSAASPIRDPVHGFITIEGRENDLLNAPVFQRLRRIHQLAMARLVYPGALHTRFDHTLGVTHVAGKLCSALDVDKHPTEIIRFAALLHDLGHGPFSHVSEDVLKALSPPELFKLVSKKEKIHELISRAIILTHRDLDSALAGKERDEIASLLDDGLNDRLHRDIISGPLDADKQDYLLRDSFFCGVEYGVYDLDQLHLSLCAPTDRDERVLMVKEYGVHALEQFVLAKYYLTTQVYKHKVRLISDNMLGRALILGAQVDGCPWLNKLYAYPADLNPDSPHVRQFVENYLKWDDQQITVELLKPEYESKHVGQLFRRLVERRLFKLLFSLKTRELFPAIRTGLAQNFSTVRPKLEAAAAQILAEQQGSAVEPHHVILNLFKIDSVRTQSRNDETPVLIARSNGFISFEEESVLFKSINEGLRDESLECYAPFGDMEDKAKKRLKEKVTEAFLQLLDREFAHQLELSIPPTKL